MADLTTAGAAAGAGLTDGIRGHIVLVDITLGGLLIDSVEKLGFTDGTEGRNGQHLGLAAGKHTGAVNTGNDTDLGIQRTDLIHAAAIYTLAVIQQPAAHHVLLQLVDALIQHRTLVGVLLVILGVQPVIDGQHTLITDILIIGIHGSTDILDELILDGLKEVMVDLHRLKGELGLADLGLYLLDEGDHLLHLCKALHNGLQHGVVVHLVGAGLDHADLIGGAGNGQLQVALLALLGVGGQDDLTIHQTDIDAGNGPVPRDIGDGQRHGCADHAGDLGNAVGVNGKDGHHNGNVVAHILGEQRTDGAVYHTAGKNSLIAGAALTLEEGAGDLAHGVQLFLKVHRKRQKIDAVTGLGGSGRIDQHGGFAVAYQHGAAGLTAHFTGLKAHLASGKFSFKYAEVFKHLFFSLLCVIIRRPCVRFSNKAFLRGRFLPSGGTIHC